MPVTLDDLDFLISPSGQGLLAQLSAKDLSETNTLKLIDLLRKDFSLKQVSAGLIQARLREKAIGKFGISASQLLFTDSALEQASDPFVRMYRAGYCHNVSVLDVCCGIGTDSMTMAEKATTVLGLDNDPVRIAIAQHNARVLGFDNLSFEVADVLKGIPARYEVVFYDPARRDSQGKRIYDVERYSPPLSLMKQWQAKQIVAKLSPGVDLNQIVPYNGGIEFISADGDLKEAVLWVGAGWHGTKATLLTATGDAYHWVRTHEPQVRVTEPHHWLVEPDASLIRAGLVQDVAEALDGTMLDETIAYFTADIKPESIWVRSWEILDWMPFNLKRLKAYLREYEVGQLTIKKRGSPLTPEDLLKKLKPSGSESRTLVLTRFQSQPIVLICRDFIPD